MKMSLLFKLLALVLVALSMVTAINAQCFQEPPYPLAFEIGTSVQRVVLSFQSEADCGPLNVLGNWRDQVRDISDDFEGFGLQVVGIDPTSNGLLITIRSPAVERDEDVLTLSLNGTALFSETVVFYKPFVLDTDSLTSTEIGEVIVKGFGRGMPRLPKPPGLRLRLHSAHEPTDLKQFQLLYRHANETEVRLDFVCDYTLATMNIADIRSPARCFPTQPWSSWTSSSWRPH
jgi:hypothetical protein